MEIWKIWFGLLAVAALVVAGSWVFLRLEKRFSGARFDERQQQARAKAYKYGFWVGIIYYFVAWGVIRLAELNAETTATLMYAGVLLQLVASFAYMLLTDAVLPFSEKPTVMFLFDFLMAGIWLSRAFQSVRATWQLFGTYDIPWDSLILSVSWLALAVMYLVSWLKERRHG